MVRITEALLVRRAEHNDGNLRTLQEIALHQQGIERIELVNQLCRRLRILYLQNNLICKIERLNRLKELENLNLAVNNIIRVQNLQRCESLRRLDLTVNFIDKAGLLSLHSLQENEHLEELHLLGNPCTHWPGYRAYVIGTLPQLQRLDGEQVRPSERIAAAQQLSELEARLRVELQADGIDPDEAAQVEDDSLLDAEHIPEPGYVDEQGQLHRPWCPATRILEHREAEAEARAAEEKRRGGQAGGGPGGSSGSVLLGQGSTGLPLRQRLPHLVEGEPVYNKNEGKWDFSLGESADGRSLQLDVAFDRYLDTSIIQADVQPTLVRLLAKGRLLQLRLPAEVRPDASVAQRSKATGNLLITMPLLVQGACLRPVNGVTLAAAAATAGSTAAACSYGEKRGGGRSGAWSKGGGSKQLALPPAVVTAAAVTGYGGDSDDEDEPPPL